MSFNQSNDRKHDGWNNTNLSNDGRELFDIWSRPIEDFTHSLTNSPTNFLTSQIHTYVPQASHDSIDAAPVALAYGFTTVTLFARS